MMVEFLGAPGSGKSTIARELARLLRGQGCRASLEDSSAPTLLMLLRGRARRLVNAQRGLLLAPSTLRRASELSRLLLQPNLTTRLRLSHYMLQLQGLCLTRRAGADLLILDQGFAQALYSFALASAAGADDTVLRSASRCLTRPALVIKLDLDETSLRHRLACRGRRRQSRVETMLEHDAGALHRTAALIDRIGASLRAEGWNLLEIDLSASGMTPQRTAAAIAEALEPLLAGRHVSADSPTRGGEPRDCGEQRDACRAE